MVLDYITGIMCAVADKKLSSAVGFKGICRKVLEQLHDRSEKEDDSKEAVEEKKDGEK